MKVHEIDISIINYVIFQRVVRELVIPFCLLDNLFPFVLVRGAEGNMCPYSFAEFQINSDVDNTPFSLYKGL